MYSIISKNIEHQTFKQEIINLLIRQITVFKDKICITFNYSPNGGKEHSRTVNIDELAEARVDYEQGVDSSNLLSSTGAFENNPNLVIFVKLKYWGVWVSKKGRV